MRACRLSDLVAPGGRSHTLCIAFKPLTGLRLGMQGATAQDSRARVFVGVKGGTPAGFVAAIIKRIPDEFEPAAFDGVTFLGNEPRAK
jgi:hypothetical protein